MNDPKKNPGQEPQRVSSPNEMPSQSKPPTEFEKNVPHGDTPVSMSGKGGEGSYEGTKKYREGYDKFAQQTSPEDAQKKAEKIDANDASLKQAEQRGKNGGTGGRISAPSIH